MKKLSEIDFRRAARALNCSVATIKAVAKIESGSSGFNPDGSPKTLFEGHHFYRFSGSTPYSVTHPHLSYRRWTRKHYGRSWRQEQSRLNQAIDLNREAALKSASWGKFQIMGFHYRKLGYQSVEDFVKDMQTSEGTQLDAFVRYVKAFGLADELQRKDWAGFAYGYNGPRYYVNRYDEKMRMAYNSFKRN
jgi:hypothetical protein